MSSQREWSVEDVADIRLTQYGGVSIYNVCCANRSLTVTPAEARQFAAALSAAADAREADDDSDFEETSTSSLPPKSDQSLRDRIAAAIARIRIQRDGDAYQMADAVIAALGLQQEWSVGDDDGGRVLWFDHEEPVTPRENEVVETRYVTGWTTDE